MNLIPPPLSIHSLLVLAPSADASLVMDSWSHQPQPHILHPSSPPRHDRFSHAQATAEVCIFELFLCRHAVRASSYLVQVALRDSLDLRASAGVSRGVPSLCAVLVSLSSRCLARGSQTRRNRSTRCCTPRAILCVDAPAISSPLGATTTRAGSGLVRKRVAACKDVGLGAAWEGEGAAGADCGCGQVCKGVYVCDVMNCLNSFSSEPTKKPGKLKLR
jgi:hypothetical protein